MLSDPSTLIRRLVWTVVQFALVMLFLMGFAPHARAQCAQPNPLCLSDNYLVTGDYVVAGVGLRGLGDATGLATGTINMPDLISVPATGVPNGADIVAAFLYWETVEKSQSAFAGQNGFFGTLNKKDGTVISSYPITGVLMGNPNAPTSWSSGGCSGSSSGTTTLRTYRADVRPYLPVDASGKILNNGNNPYQVRLADSGSNGGGTPLTLGATLVLIYRVLSTPLPLNAIVIYDGAFAPSNQSAPMSQVMQGFYQASTTTVPTGKLTHIVGDGQPNKYETVLLNNATLPSLYGTLPPFPGEYNQNTISPTGGGSWDNPTWTFPNSLYSNLSISGGSATTSVQSSGSGSGCVDWGTVIFSTTVQNSDGDGILDVWKQNQGYVDAQSNQWVSLPGAQLKQKDLFVELDWLTDLDGSAGLPAHTHLPKQAAIDKVGDALKNQTPSVHVHFDLGPGIYQGDPYVISYPVPPAPTGVATFSGAGGNAIEESILVCTESGTLCQYPGQATVGWKGGFLVVRNTEPNPNSTPPVPLMGNFQPGRGLSYHYVLFGHALGAPRTYWSAAGTSPALSSLGIATLNSISVTNNVGTVTLTTPPNLLKPGDPACSDTCDRVTIGGALLAQTVGGALQTVQTPNAALNGTFKFLASPTSNCDGSGTCTTTFTIQIPNPPGLADGIYQYFNPKNPFASEPQLGLAFGGPTSASGYSDIGGGDTAVMFGLWPADDPTNCQPDPTQPLTTQNPTYCTNEVGTITAQAGTLLHELGHTLTLTHGGTFYPTTGNPNGTMVASGALAGQQTNSLVAPVYGLNCNPALLSSMNYLFQIRGFPDGGIGYSGQTLPALDETMLNEGILLNGIVVGGGIGTDLFTNALAAHYTRWYAPPNPLDTQLQKTATAHCDGSPILDGAQMVRVEGSTFSAPIDWNNNLIVPDPTEPVSWQDVNFNGSTLASPDPASPPAFNDMQGFNDWVNFDLRQIGARDASFAFSGQGGSLFAPGGGSLFAPGGGSLFAPGGGSLFAPGGGSLYAGGGGSLFAPGGGSLFAPGGGSLYAIGGGSEQDRDMACSIEDPPTLLTPALGSKSVVLNWTPPEQCQVNEYDIWRATGSFSSVTLTNRTAFTEIKTLSRGGAQNPPLPTTFTDSNVKNNTTYTYFITAKNLQGAGSGPSNLKSIFVKF